MEKEIKKKKIAAAALISLLVAVCALNAGPSIIAEDASPTSPVIPEYFSSIRVTLSASDDNSGIAHTYYAIDPGASPSWTEYSGPFVVTGAGNHAVHYYSVDNAGNTEAVHIKEFKITYDSTPPTTTISLVPVS